jgi:aspartate carbamoyltransferase catalytic subunit
MPWKGRDIISINDFSAEEIEEFISLTYEIKSRPADFREVMRDRQLALLFFEPSTRTFTSFRNAMTGMGGRISMEFRDAKGTSVEKGESIRSTLEMAVEYGTDIVVIRHPSDGAAAYCRDVAGIPVINGGDGYHEHPTQNLMDLYTIHEKFGRLDNLTFLFFNDLKYGRATRIILPLSAYEGNRFFFLSHPLVSIPDHIKKTLDSRGREWEEFFDEKKFPELLGNADVAYGSRTQEERFPETAEGKEMLSRVRDSVVLTKNVLEKARPGNLIIMHPLPMDRNHPCIAGDMGPYAYWNRQAGNGIPARQAMLCLILGAAR